ELDRGKGSLMASGIVLLVSLFLMRMVTWQSEIPRRLDPIVAAFAAEEPPKPAEPIEPPDEMPGEQTEVPETEPVETAEEPEPVEPEPAQDMPNEQPDPPESETPDVEPPPPAEPEALTASTADPAKEPADQTNPTNSGVSETPPEQPASAHSADDSRSGARREELLKKYGGSQQSEAAVGRALQWLASIQHPQGWWDFVQVGPAGTPGTVNNPIGGTAYALLPFLAAGHTHKSGDYRKQVQSGLNYLTQIGVTVPAGYDLRGMINKQSDDREPNEAYYVHGAATLVLCEAFGMTKDRRLKPAAEGAVRFLVNSQDPRGGGWRYSPQEPGSTSVTAIQVMALKAAQKAGLNVPDSVLHRVSVYLDSVQVDGQGRYGYEIQRKSYKGSVTAMALLCRMYLGWQREDGDLRAGVALLDKAGPYDNLYTTYFATQVMKNWGGEEWDRWNQRVRDDLIAGQESEGPAAGSWRPRTGAIHAKQGGRLLTTVLATLTLEVYYRYSPLLPEAGPHTEPKVVPDADSGAAALKASDE
ncbi:MAG: hypothetical protein KDA89_20550, partial [Planctomycetaceae bacterium]|nr:hypothetical protein [Planctomycetaceae bacterium]